MSSRVNCRGLASRLVRQQLRRPEKRRVQRISVDVVKAEMVDGNLDFAGCPRVVAFKCEGTGLASSIEEPRVAVARVEEWF